MDKPATRVLIADDDMNLRLIFGTELSHAGFHVTEADSGTAAMDLLEKDEFDVLILDLRMPGLSGLDVLERIRALGIPTEVIILTGYATVSTAVEAMKLGAYDYLTKPFKLAALKAVVEKAYEKKRLVNENLSLRTQLSRQSETSVIITRNPRMKEILEVIDKVAKSDMPVLVSGESGVGKELIAKKVHDSSERARGPFIPINCGAIPDAMLESELFGHEKGAFTGAHAGKSGLLEIANQGTLFLDEIGELTMPLQGKLLRALETGRFFRVGGVRQIRVNVRLVSATNKDIKAEIGRGHFREDLYYRISAFIVDVPPLRERKEDVPLLVEHFMKSSPSFRRKHFSEEAMAALTKYSWPGNIRELKNVIHRTLILSKDDVVDCGDLPPDLIKEEPVTGSRIEDMERNYILKILKQAGGHRAKSAEILGIDPKTLYRKLRRYGIER